MRAGGCLSEWYGERTLHRFLGGKLIPDSYAVLSFPDRRQLHLFVELDRGTETLERLREKAERYQEVLGWREVREFDPLVLFVVPSERRARSVAGALADQTFFAQLRIAEDDTAEPTLAEPYKQLLAIDLIQELDDTAPERLARQTFGQTSQGAKRGQNDRTPDLALVRGSISNVMVEPTRLNANHFARLSGGQMALDGQG